MGRASGFDKSRSQGRGKRNSFRALRDFILSWQKEALRSEAKRTAKPARRASAQREVKSLTVMTSKNRNHNMSPCNVFKVTCYVI